jgi:hypothetical protein
MTIIEQLVEDYKRQNPDATPAQIKEYLQTLETHTKVIKEDEWAFNSEHDDGIKIPDDVNISDDVYNADRSNTISSENTIETRRND